MNMGSLKRTLLIKCCFIHWQNIPTASEALRYIPTLTDIDLKCSAHSLTVVASLSNIPVMAGLGQLNAGTVSGLMWFPGLSCSSGVYSSGDDDVPLPSTETFIPGHRGSQSCTNVTVLKWKTLDSGVKSRDRKDGNCTAQIHAAQPYYKACLSKWKSSTVTSLQHL